MAAGTSHSARRLRRPLLVRADARSDHPRRGGLDRRLPRSRSARLRRCPSPGRRSPCCSSAPAWSVAGTASTLLCRPRRGRPADLRSSRSRLERRHLLERRLPRGLHRAAAVTGSLAERRWDRRFSEPRSSHHGQRRHLPLRRLARARPASERRHGPPGRRLPLRARRRAEDVPAWRPARFQRQPGNSPAGAMAFTSTRAPQHLARAAW